VQRTDPQGNVVFQTIFPGFYPGRTNHIHFKVRVAGNTSDGSHSGEHLSHIGQIFFPEKLTVELMQNRPYCDHRIERTPLSDDGVFVDQQGATSIDGFRQSVSPRSQVDCARRLSRWSIRMQSRQQQGVRLARFTGDLLARQLTF